MSGWTDERINYPLSSDDCYIEPDELAEPAAVGHDETLLHAETAANFIACLVSDFTGEEVDGDGDPWGIACQHLSGLLHNLREALTIDTSAPRIVLAGINEEYGYSIGGAR